MKTHDPGTESLRLRATQLIYGADVAANANGMVLKAMSALKELSESPENGALALAFLHELQVHQVELAMQEEDLRHAQAERQAAMRRQTRLFDHAPVACFAVEADSSVSELNRAACHLIDIERHLALGLDLGTLFVPESRAPWKQMLAEAKAGRPTGPTLLQLSRHATVHRVLAAIEPDPEGSECFVSLTDLGTPHG